MELECFKSLAIGLPTSLFIKFLARDKCYKFVALLMIGIAPSDFKSFSATLRTCKVSFWDSAIPMHSPPSGPKSLSLIESESKTLFLIKSAEIQTAP